MRHFTLAAFAVATLYVVGGCGNGNKVSLDGGGDMAGGGSDFATAGGDMTVAKASACGSIYDCLGQGKSLATCEAKSPTASKQKFADFLGCMQNTCGVMGTDAGATAPCMVAGDLGVAECDQCFTNVIATCDRVPQNCTAMTSTFFVDMNQMPVTCAADGTPAAGTDPASDCGKCIEAATACIFECYMDVDCAMLQHQDGSPATCDTTTNQCM